MTEAPALAEWIFEQMADAAIYADRSGTIVRWNRAAAALFGHSAAEALGFHHDGTIEQLIRSAMVK